MRVSLPSLPPSLPPSIRPSLDPGVMKLEWSRSATIIHRQESEKKVSPPSFFHSLHFPPSIFLTPLPPSLPPSPPPSPKLKVHNCFAFILL